MRLFMAFIAALILTGCRSINPRDYAVESEVRPASASTTSRWHTVRMPARTNAPSIHACNKINPLWWFGNADEPSPPAWYRPESACRDFLWHCRNSFHNFDDYVIGVSDKETARAGRYPTLTSNPNGGWNIAITKYKRWRLPFADYKRGRFEFYFGWRERGNFGIKLILKKPEPKKQETPSIPSRP